MVIMKKFHIDYSFFSQPAMFGEVSLIQLGVMHCSCDMIIKKHAHGDFFELTIVTDGEGSVIVNDTSCHVKAGDIHLSFQGDVHEIIPSESNPLKFNFFAFNTTNDVLKNELKKIVSIVRTSNQRVFRDDAIGKIVSDAIAEYDSGEAYSKEIMTLFFEQIIYYLIRDFSQIKKAGKEKYINSYDELCFQVMHYIDANICHIKSLNELSKIFKYNYSYLSSIYKKTTGTTIEEYYRLKRLDTALLLLQKEKKLNVTDVSKMLNYSSLYSFSKAFKQRFGMSPTKYVKSQTHSYSEWSI